MLALNNLLVLLLSETAARGESGLATGGLGHDLTATLANNDGLSVAEDGSDFKAVWAFDVHEEAVWGLHQSLFLVFGFFLGQSWMEEIDGERHFCKGFLF